eukprot:1184400-Rhodomonas_salina.4
MRGFRFALVGSVSCVPHRTRCVAAESAVGAGRVRARQGQARAERKKRARADETWVVMCVCARTTVRSG